MATRIKNVEIDSAGLQQMIVNSLNLRDSKSMDSVKIPVGLVSDGSVISVVIELIERDGTTTGIDIPYEARDECLGKMNDTVTIELK
jgi:hypothetical protein